MANNIVGLVDGVAGYVEQIDVDSPGAARPLLSRLSILTEEPYERAFGMRGRKVSIVVEETDEERVAAAIYRACEGSSSGRTLDMEVGRTRERYATIAKAAIAAMGKP